MKPDEIRAEIKRILDKFSEEQIRDALRLVELTVQYNEIMGIE